MKETLKTLADSKYALYGPLKALSEQEAQKWFPGQALVIRPGLIVGPGDESDRLPIGPCGWTRGGKVLAPGAPGDPVQFIDARDLAEWTVRMAEGTRDRRLQRDRTGEDGWRWGRCSTASKGIAREGELRLG